MPRREAGARLHETCVTLGNRHGDPRRNERALAGRQDQRCARREVEARVPRVSTVRHPRPFADTHDRELDHRFRARAAGSETR